ncbi:MAG: cysteine hydrolase [Desulfobacteraceae bacterium]|nr:cysteine hydrolase [Desulfobacteraceae bacterium]
MMNTIILTLDFINDICDPKGKIARAADRIKTNQVIEHTNRILTWGRQQQAQKQGLKDVYNLCLIAHVKVGFRAGYADCPSHSPIFGAAKKYGALQLGTWGTKFCNSLILKEDEPIIIKHRVSAFYGTDLETLLRCHRIEHLILLGVSTNNAVELTAREAHDRDYRVTIIADACETYSDAAQQASLNFLTGIANVINTDELIK